MNMKRLCLLMALLVLVFYGISTSQFPPERLPDPQFTQKNFLLTEDIGEFTLDLAIEKTDSLASLALKPVDMVELHVNVNGEMKDIFIFADDAFNRLTVWQCSAINQGYRKIERISDYHGPAGRHLFGPSGIDTNAKNRIFDPDRDMIFLADMLNGRVLELSYLPDSAGGKFEVISVIGEGILERPADVAISAYGDQDSLNADLYVTDMGLAEGNGKLHRFDIGTGQHENTWQAFYFPETNYEVGKLISPVSVACCPDTIPYHSAIYVTDEVDNTMYYLTSAADDNLSWVSVVDLEEGADFSRAGGIATDDFGRIYVANVGTGKIEIFGPNLSYLYEPYGSPGVGPGHFQYPQNIILDTYYGSCEALVIQFFFRDSGFKSFNIENGAQSGGIGKGFINPNLLRPLVKTPAQIPTSYVLNNNYPNPFNSTTKISFALPKKSHVIIEVFNIMGQKAATIVDEDKDAGQYSINFHAQNLNSGIYFYRIRAGEFSQIKSMILLK